MLLCLQSARCYLSSRIFIYLFIFTPSVLPPCACACDQHWMAPEVFLGANYDERVDVYSLGIVMWEIITSRRPFEDVSPWLIPAAVVERRQRPALPEWIPAPYAELISAAWAQDHTQRPSAQQLLECLHALLERAPADDSWPTA